MTLHATMRCLVEESWIPIFFRYAFSTRTKKILQSASKRDVILRSSLQRCSQKKSFKSFNMRLRACTLASTQDSLFNYKGYLCKHALNVLNYNGIEEIPSGYILNRWRRDFKQTFNQFHVSDNIDTYNPVDLYTHMFNSALPVLEVGAQSQEHYMVAVKELEELLGKFDIEDNNLL